jgi:serine/threonine protein phosphatase PrpC
MTTAGLAVLWGRDHTALQQVAIEVPHPSVAVGLTRGRFPKGYAHLDPNEDVAAAVVAATGTVLVVADGHNGVAASEAAVKVVLDRFAVGVPRAGLDSLEWAQLFLAASEAVVGATADLDGPHRASRTTLAVALISGRSVQWAGMGDSAVFVVDGGRAKQLNVGRSRFVGHPVPLRDVRRDLETGLHTPRRPGWWVVLATDGLTTFVRPAPKVIAAAAAEAQVPDDLVRRLIATAGDAGAGDNVAVAVAKGG